MRPRMKYDGNNTGRRFDRLFAIKFIFITIGLVFIGRLFYLQIIKHEYYKSSARAEQFKQLEIEPERGTISVMNGGNDPVVLAINESRYTIFADPAYIKNAPDVAAKVSPIIGDSATSIEEKLSRDLRYVILAKKITKDKKDELLKLDIKGIGIKEERIRAYPQGNLAPHVLGFVNDEGDGQYGIEGFLNNELKGTPGILQAITDIQGTPLVLNRDNVVTTPKDGTDVVLSIDQTIQRLSEDELKSGVERSGAKSGSVIVMEADTGRVKAMANYPSYDVSNYTQVEDQAVFQNRVVSEPLEPGSILKTLTVATALDIGVVGKESTYFDAGYVQVDDSKIKNVTDLGAGTRTTFDILHYSLNTGAVHLLQQMGGGDITEQGRSTFYDYLINHYLFNTLTGIEQQEEAAGSVSSPTEGDGLRVRYANMSFGQGLSVTLTQFAGALSSVVNGGTYYKPTIIYSKGDGDNQTVQNPVISQDHVVSSRTSSDLVSLMKDYIDVMAPAAKREGFIVGGKTGTAQLAKPEGGYREDAYNATFAGFMGRTRPKYVIVIRLDEGSAARNFGGFQDASPVFIGIVNGIMDNIPIVQ